MLRCTWTYCGEIAAVETLAADGFMYGYATRIFYDDILEQVEPGCFCRTMPQVLYLAKRVTVDGIRYEVTENFVEDYHFFQVAILQRHPDINSTPSF